MTMQPTLHPQETKIVSADATALGVFGLALVTFVASSQKMGWTTGSAYLMPWALFLGSVAQIWAAAIDFKRNSYFGAIVLGAFGLFWIAVTMHWGIANGWFGIPPENADPRQFGYACFGYFIFCVFVTVAAFESNKVFGAIMVLILVLLGSLGLQLLGINPEGFGKSAAWAEFLIALLGFYAAGAIFLNNFFGHTILPLGAPMGWVKKS
ncbi:MAG: GPR1/FUN34/YaaH family transporter [Zoogloeaceae bacterium]|jgi:succinate-acetate transporter protein|nr:GPR1/FUN34/YaaH family transporter [Zoogloeaceae bacterium]